VRCQAAGPPCGRRGFTAIPRPYPPGGHIRAGKSGKHLLDCRVLHQLLQSPGGVAGAGGAERLDRAQSGCSRPLSTGSRPNLDQGKRGTIAAMDRPSPRQYDGQGDASESRGASQADFKIVVERRKAGWSRG